MAIGRVRAAQKQIEFYTQERLTSCSSENITDKHFRNITWVSKPIAPVVLNEEGIFTKHWENHGR